MTKIGKLMSSSLSRARATVPCFFSRHIIIRFVRVGTFCGHSRHKDVSNDTVVTCNGLYFNDVSLNWASESATVSIVILVYAEELIALE